MSYNSTQQNRSEPNEFNPFEDLSRVVTYTNIFTSTTSVIGNSLVILIMARKQPNVFRLLLTHLAFCDLLFATVQFCDIPQWLYMRWIYNKDLCKVLPPSLLLTSLASVGTILVIAIERHNGILNPLKDKWRRKHLIVALTLTWAFSIISTSPFVAVSEVEDVEGISQCVESWNVEDKQSARFIYSVYLFCSGFVIPVILLVVLYGRIVILSRKPENCLIIVSKSLRKRQRNDVRVTKLLVAVVIAFVICVLPNHIGTLILQSADSQMMTATEKIFLHLFALIPYPFHCTVNPVIYSVIDLKFRQDLKKLFLCQDERHFRRETLRLNSMETRRSNEVSSRESSKYMPNN